MPQPPPRRLLRLAGTRMTNNNVAATSLEQPLRGFREEAPPRAADTGVLVGAPGRRALRTSSSLSFSYLSLGDAGDTGAMLGVTAGQREGIAGGFVGAARRAGGAAQVTATHAMGWSR